MAVALVLLVGAGLLMRSFQRVLSVDPASTGRLTARVALSADYRADNRARRLGLSRNQARRRPRDGDAVQGGLPISAFSLQNYTLG